MTVINLLGETYSGVKLFKIYRLFNKQFIKSGRINAYYQFVKLFRNWGNQMWIKWSASVDSYHKTSDLQVIHFACKTFDVPNHKLSISSTGRDCSNISFVA